MIHGSAGIETPDEALARVMDMPGLSPNQVTAAENWALNENRRRAEFGRSWVRDKKAEIRTRSEDLDARIFDVTRAARDIQERIKRREFADTDSAFKESKRLHELLEGYEREFSALQTTQATADEVAADPAGYFHSFYRRFPALWDRVPRIEEAL